MKEKTGYSRKTFDSKLLAKKLYNQREEIFRRIEEKNAISRYVSVIKGCGLLSDQYRNEFKNFYAVRLQTDTTQQILMLMKEYQNKKIVPSINESLKELHKLTGKVHISFASKIIATLNPEKPVYDDKVKGHLMLRHPQGDMGMAIKIYGCLQNRMEELLKGSDVERAIRAFNERFSEDCIPEDCKKITRIKKLDLMLWQMR